MWCLFVGLTARPLERGLGLGALAGLALANLLATCLFAQKSPASFCVKLEAIAAEPAVASAHWGVSVTTLDGKRLCGINEAQLFRPASNNKLFTAAAALTLLGPDRQFTTLAIGGGDLADGLLHGSLLLIGGGDANFGASDLPYLAPAQRPASPTPQPTTIANIEAMADALYAKGLRSIEGTVIGYDHWFAWEPYPFGWEVDDLDGYDGAPVSALTIHDNALEIGVVAGDDGKALVSTTPDTSYYSIENGVVLTQSKENCHAHLSYKRTLGGRSVALFGSISPSAPPCKLDQAIQDPAEYAARALKQALERRGVHVGGSAQADHDLYAAGPLSGTFQEDPHADRVVRKQLALGTPLAAKPGPVPPQWSASRPVLATHTSAPLIDDLTYTLKASQNLHAEVMLRNIGASLPCTEGNLLCGPPFNESGETLGESLAAVRAFLTEIGIDRRDIILYDGSGLSGHDLTTPRALTQVLVYATGQKWFEAFKAALPVGGVDGTLATRFIGPASSLTGKVFAKTGTLGQSRALSGYLTAASGRTVVFSIMVDNHAPGGADRTAMDRMVEAIAAAN